MRLIDADELKRMMFSYDSRVTEYTDKRDSYGKTLMAHEVELLIDDCIDNAPTIEAEPVEHAHFVIDWLGSCTCSRCKSYADYSSKYCGECGARFDEQEERE